MFPGLQGQFKCKNQCVLASNPVPIPFHPPLAMVGSWCCGSVLLVFIVKLVLFL